MRFASTRHDALLRAALQSHGGHLFKSMGDQFCAAFATAPEALAAALTAQRALGSEPWDEVAPVRVRMALHTGAAEQRDRDYFGPPLNRGPRRRGPPQGDRGWVPWGPGAVVGEPLGAGARRRILDLHRLKALQHPERLSQLLHPELPAVFPPPRSLEAFAHNLPAQ